jgi:hypothetical protein
LNELIVNTRLLPICKLNIKNSGTDKTVSIKTIDYCAYCKNTENPWALRAKAPLKRPLFCKHTLFVIFYKHTGHNIIGISLAKSCVNKQFCV